MRARRWTLLAIGAFAIGAFSALTPGLAGAHAALEESRPANGEALDSAPTEILLRFTEPPDLELTTIGVVSSTGASVETGPVRAAPDRAVRVPLPDLPDGVYTVTWRTVSQTDGHVTASALSFGVGVSADEVGPIDPSQIAETPPPTPMSVGGRWALYVGLVILFAAGVGGLFAFGPEVATRAWVLAGAWALAVAGVLLMIAAERASVGVSLGTLLGSDTGAGLLRLGVTVVVAGLAAGAAAMRPGRETLAVLAAAVALALLARVIGGHAGGSAGPVVLQWLHLVGVGTWIGGLVWLALGLRRGLESSVVRRFSTLAAGGLLLVFSTGVLRASNELGGLGWWLHAFDSDYGTALAIKLALVTPLVALGALNRYRNVPRLAERGPRALRRTVAGELVLAAGVFAVTGVLTGLPPDEARAEPAAPQRLVVEGSDFATTTTVRLLVTPGTVGPNAFVATVRDFDTAEPVDAQRVSLDFELPGRPEVSALLELEPRDDGTWAAEGTPLSLPGAWEVTVLIEHHSGSVEVPLEVRPRTEQRIEVSRVEGQPNLTTIHLAGGLQLQSYVDPGITGRTNQVHVTAFDASGTELPLARISVVAEPPSGEPVELELIEFSPGHVAANLELEPGTWGFRIDAEAEDGSILFGTFEQTFEG